MSEAQCNWICWLTVANILIAREFVWNASGIWFVMVGLAGIRVSTVNGQRFFASKHELVWRMWWWIVSQCIHTMLKWFQVNFRDIKRRAKSSLRLYFVKECTLTLFVVDVFLSRRGNEAAGKACFCKISESTSRRWLLTCEMWMMKLVRRPSSKKRFSNNVMLNRCMQWWISRCSVVNIRTYSPLDTFCAKIVPFIVSFFTSFEILWQLACIGRVHTKSILCQSCPLLVKTLSTKNTIEELAGPRTITAIRQWPHE